MSEPRRMRATFYFDSYVSDGSAEDRFLPARIRECIRDDGYWALRIPDPRR